MAKRIIRSLLFLALLAAPVVGQVDVVFPGYRVFVADNDSTISTHQTYHVALERAVNFAINSGRATRIELVGPVRVTVDPSVIPQPDPEPPPADTVPTHDPDPDPDPDPQPDPQPDPGPPPAPGEWVVEQWSYASVDAMYAQPDLYINHSGNGGISRPIKVSNTPWGGTTALENYFWPASVGSQPQVGTGITFPSLAPEVWIDMWIRFDPQWDVGPGSNLDHKTMFLWEGNFVQRWEIKFGPNGQDCVGGIGGSHYEIGFIPPLGAWDYDLYTANEATRCRASQRVWGGGWHRLQWHAKIGAGNGEFEAWVDGVKFLESLGMNTQSGAPGFGSLAIGANRNAGPAVAMSFYVSPVRVYRVRPANWPS